MEEEEEVKFVVCNFKSNTTIKYENLNGEKKTITINKKERINFVIIEDSYFIILEKERIQITTKFIDIMINKLQSILKLNLTYIKGDIYYNQNNKIEYLLTVNKDIFKKIFKRYIEKNSGETICLI